MAQAKAAEIMIACPGSFLLSLKPSSVFIQTARLNLFKKLGTSR
jgi:hypothetical protein